MQPSSAPRRAPPPVLVAKAPKPPQVDGKSRLQAVTTGLVEEPFSVLIYGVEGVGKTSFAAAAPKPLIVGAEHGSAEIGTAARYAPNDLADVLGILEALRIESHSYETVVIDSLDWLEPLVHASVCERGDKPTIESFGYGAGYKDALVEWRQVLKAVDLLRAKGMHVILVAHSLCKPFKNPDANQGDYDRFSLKIHERAAGLFKEWSKAVLFANFERATIEKDHRTKGLDTGRRLLFTRMSAAYDAKNRLWLPPEIPLGWAPFQRAVDTGRSLRQAFYKAIEALTSVRRAEILETIERDNYDPSTVSQVVEDLKGAVS